MTTFYDAFDRADGALGANWNTIVGSPAISGEAVIYASGTVPAKAACIAITEAGRQEVVVTIGTANSGNNRAGPVCRCLTNASGFEFSISGTTRPYTAQIVYAIGPVTVATAAWDHPMPPQQTLRLVWNAGHLSGYADGTLVVEGDSGSGFDRNYMGLMVPNGRTGSVLDFRAIGGAALGLSANPVVVGNYGTCTDIDLTGTNTAWDSVSNTPTFTVDHGTISAQTVHSATTATITYCPGSFLGTATITDPSTGQTVTITVTSDPLVVPPPGAGDTWSPYKAMVDRTGINYEPGALLTDAHVVRLTPVLSIPAALDYLIILTRNLYNPAPDWPDGEPAPDVRLDALWDWLSGGAELAGLPQTPSTSTPIKVDTERILAFLKADPNNWTSLADVVSLLGGSPTVYSHHDLKQAIDLIDWQSILTRLAEIQPNTGISLTILANLINNATSGGQHDLAEVLTAIGNLNPATATGLTLATASIQGSLGGIALEIAGLYKALGVVEATNIFDTISGILGDLFTGLGESLVNRFLDSITQQNAAQARAALVPPIWPGNDYVDWGTEVPIESNTPIVEEMHGVVVNITGCEGGISFYDYDGIRNYRHLGALAFCSDRGDQEPFQALGATRAIYTVKTMHRAFACRLYRSHNVRGTVRAWKQKADIPWLG